MTRCASALAIGFILAGAISLQLSASAPSGAIFTTVADGREVNFNIYPAKEAVYLDGGPGPGAPQTAAGLDDGIYVFQVTDPSGKTLLSTDKAKCRQVTVLNGIIISTVPSDASCGHVTGFDVDHGAVTVQLMPYNNTPNNGGVYKAWVTRQADYVASCLALNASRRRPVTNFNALEQVDCGYNAGNFHGFVTTNTKTDNFKVKNTVAREIDTKFCNDLNSNGICEPFNGEPWIDGLGITWIDTLNSSNKKWSYLNAAIDVNHEAHVEDVETGLHRITIPSQAGCTVRNIQTDQLIEGPNTVDVNVTSTFTGTIFIYVACTVS